MFRKIKEKIGNRIRKSAHTNILEKRILALEHMNSCLLNRITLENAQGDFLVRYISSLPKYLYHMLPYDCEGVSKVRMGRDGDGGYVVPLEAVKNCEALLGLGIAGDSSFEEAFVTQTHKKAYGVDFSIDALPFVEDVTVRENIIFCKNRIIDKKNKKHSYDIDFVSFLKKHNLDNQKIGIKMDIEGAEYGVLQDIFLKHLENIQFLVIEFHTMSNYENELLHIFEKLEQFMTLIHVHANNNVSYYGFNFLNNKPCIFPTDLVELTFVNNVYFQNKKISEEKYPGEYDQKNIADKSDLLFNYIDILRQHKDFES